MKQLDRINFRHSFAAKICLWMLITSACVFLVCFGTASWFASKMMLGDGHKKANLELDKAILYITDEMNATETAGVNFAAEKATISRGSVPEMQRLPGSQPQREGRGHRF